MDLTTLWSRIASLSLFSPNEVLEDISTRDLVYLFVPFVCAQVRARIRTTAREERTVLLDQTQVRPERSCWKFSTFGPDISSARFTRVRVVSGELRDRA